MRVIYLVLITAMALLALLLAAVSALRAQGPQPALVGMPEYGRLLTASPEVPVMVAGTLYNTVTLGEQPLPLSLDQQYYSDEHRLVGLRRQVVMLDGQVITLTPRQYRLLALFVEHAREVVPRATVFTQLWGYAPQGCAPLNAHLWRLRKRLGAYADQYIETVVGVGCRFRPPPGP